jgi:hypothetical protein
MSINLKDIFSPTTFTKIDMEHSGRNRGSGFNTMSANELAQKRNALGEYLTKLNTRWSEPWKNRGKKEHHWNKMKSAKSQMASLKKQMDEMRAARRSSYEASGEGDDFGANPFAQDGGMPDYKDPSLALGGIAGQPLETINRSSTSNKNDYHLNPEAYTATLQSPSAVFDPATTDAAANMFFGNAGAAFGTETLAGSANNTAWQQNYTPTTAPLTEETDWSNILTS